MSTPIDYMTTDELLLELKKRFNEMLFVGYKEHPKKDDSYSICVKSTLHGTYGLIEVLTRAADAQEAD
jgi:hypothetical protein